MPSPHVAILATIAASFFAAALVPGPSSITVMRASLSGGVKPGIATAIGVASSNAFYAALAALGLVALIEAAGAAFVVIKIVGGLYLLHLGLRMAINRGRSALHAEEAQAMPFQRALLRGMLTDLSNPKSIMAFFGIFAVAYPAHPPLSLSIASVAIVGGISLTWHSLLAYLFAQARLRQFYHLSGRWVDRIGGTIIGAFGAALAASSL
jgi:threonine/homoserine/homoserine lactone efflux protein